MLNDHRIATTSFRTWGEDITESCSQVSSPTNLTPEQSFQSITSWADIGEEHVTMLAYERCSTEHRHTHQPGRKILAGVQCNSLSVKDSSKDVFAATDLPTQEMATIADCGKGLLARELKAGDQTQATYIPEYPRKLAPMFQTVLRRRAKQIDVPHTLRRLEQAVSGCKEVAHDLYKRMTEKYASVQARNHTQIMPIVTNQSTQLYENAMNPTVDRTLSLRNTHTEHDTLQSHLEDKSVFAQVIGYKAECALLEQGICKDWQMTGEQYIKMQHTLQASLMHTFTRIQQLYTNVPLHRAKPQWAADEEKHAWVLELDVGRVGVEVGPRSDTSLIELGLINTGFELHGCCSPASALAPLRCASSVVTA